MVKPLSDIQVRTVEYGIENPYSIFGLQMGLGKSRCSIEIQHKTDEKMLVVCPPYLIKKWYAEIKKWHPEKTVSVFDQRFSFYLPWDTDISIVGYSNLKYAEVLFGWAEYIVIDESHYLKNMKAQRTELVHRYIYENSPKRISLLTGTPIKNRVEEFYSLIALCHYIPGNRSIFLEKFPDPITFADYFSYRKEYVLRARGRPITQVKWEGIREENIPELKSYLKGHYIRFETTTKEPTYIPVQLGLEDSPELLDAFEQYQINKSSVKIEAKALSAKIKAEYTVSYVKDLLEQVEKVVVFTDHVEPCEEIAEALGVPAITGKMSMDKRNELQRGFQFGSDRVIVATIGSFSTGIDLDAAQDLVFNDLSWVPGDNSQAEFRVRRMTQEKAVNIHYILGSEQDEKIMIALENKQEVIKAAT